MLYNILETILEEVLSIFFSLQTMTCIRKCKTILLFLYIYSINVMTIISSMNSHFKIESRIKSITCTTCTYIIVIILFMLYLPLRPITYYVYIYNSNDKQHQIRSVFGKV